VTFDQLLASSGLARLDARALLEAASGHSREWLAAHGDESADARLVAQFQALAARRRAGEPLAYLLGWREFLGRRFEVGPAVLVPRPETEELVEHALAALAAIAALAGIALPDRPPRPRALDLGTGSGVIAISLALARPDAHVTATDASADALAMAASNARRLGATGVRFLGGDWWDALPPDEPAFDIVVSNPPYVPRLDPHLLDPALRREPQMALASGDDGLDAIRRIVAGAPARLAPGGWLLIEHGHDQGLAVAALLSEAGLVDVATHRDAAGQPRVGAARKPLV
jgi:release factor glutamine methyltransferase